MGTDYGAFLLEAARVLKPGGWLWVAEVSLKVLPIRPMKSVELKGFVFPVACIFRRLGEGFREEGGTCAQVQRLAVGG
jgi:ubiquinone/menaquinone biosynthesis C-methylase UbiE